jgi:hypothetical protein
VFGRIDDPTSFCHTDLRPPREYGYASVAMAPNSNVGS